MLNIPNELKAKLLAAQSAEEAAALVKSNGQEITSEEAEKLWEEIEHIREAEGRKLSKDELDAVSAGFGFDPPSGCTLMFTA
jgi:Zn-dependent M16 (insulinase) family peptidase